MKIYIQIEPTYTSPEDSHGAMRAMSRFIDSHLL
jgi:hypothetical protein